MKTLFTLSTLVSMVITGIASLRLFQNAHYDISALLTITSFVSIILWISVVSNKKVVLS
jgi:hypothetical protein